MCLCSVALTLPVSFPRRRVGPWGLRTVEISGWSSVNEETINFVSESELIRLLIETSDCAVQQGEIINQMISS
jgi:hypothetical protein